MTTVGLYGLAGSNPVYGAYMYMWPSGSGNGLQLHVRWFDSSHVLFADVAQLAVQLTCNQQVEGSSPSVGSKNLAKIILKYQCRGGEVSSAQGISETYIVTAMPDSFAR